MQFLLKFCFLSSPDDEGVNWESALNCQLTLPKVCELVYSWGHEYHSILKKKHVNDSSDDPLSWRACRPPSATDPLQLGYSEILLIESFCLRFSVTG